MRPPVQLVLAVIALAAAACTSVAAAAVVTPDSAADSTASAAPPSPAPASVQIVQRLRDDAAAGVPDVVGLRRMVAVARLRAAGVEAQVVVVGRRDARVTAQWPEAGTPPTSQPAVVWVGRPPTTPSAPKAPEPEADSAPKTPAPEDKAAPAPATTSTTVTSPGSGATPGLEGFVPPPHGPRANIRTLPPAPAGARLAGRASWYGPGFDGHQTACGGTFDSSQPTLATRELRCGTVVTVTGQGGSVTATVTDWGPAEWTGRRFDLSRATFEAVASLSSGVVDVTLTVE